MSEEEREVYEILSETLPKPISEIMTGVPYGKSKVTEILKRMVNAGVVKIKGNGRGTKYHL
ncbi:helix-turn-helix domain-containing protein [Acetivibrio ethanolgignens]|uniref:Transcription regulator TrmB N-terminal domain-containing protein n=1 Tax=Acetivibrio ethanolgignens TaxID=290052 RepID=A0A0V8QC25_9FIRM|nr:helix-turn-helix domain-containing protein [Acetivibrio ethanolgignens]KSV58117.1 hypothetical protein ASU35_03540 [Acetivibrio ethanolgignens]